MYLVHTDEQVDTLGRGGKQLLKRKLKKKRKFPEPSTVTTTVHVYNSNII